MPVTRLAQPQTLDIPLRGAGGEPVDLWRTIVSHGVADLPPARVDQDGRAYETTIALDPHRPRTVRIRERRGAARLEVAGPRLKARERELLQARLGFVLGLHEDLSGFYALAREDPDLAWAARGAGRMLRTPTVYEAVVKTICTTNCAWSATVRMVSALVEHLGEPSVGSDPSGPYGRAFPEPAAMAAAPEAFYRDVVRAGYRAAYLHSLAVSVASAAVDLEQLGRASPEELPDEELAARLLGLPGIGPYGAAHIMMLLGRHSRLILDSWTRPTFLRVSGMRRAKDATIERRFRRYGPYAGLAFWLYLTRDWVTE